MLKDPAGPIEGDPAISASAVDRLGARDAYITGMPPRMLPLAPSELADDARSIAADLRRAAGLPPHDSVSEFIAIVGRHASLLGAHTALAIVLMSKGALSSRDRELAVLRTGWLCQAPYEWGEHVAMGKRTAGLTIEEIERVTVGSTAPGWNDHDRAIVRAAEELHYDAMISDEIWAVLSERLDEQQLIELPILIGQYHGVAYLQNSLRMRLNPSNIGLSAR